MSPIGEVLKFCQQAPQTGQVGGGCGKLPYGKTHVAIASSHRFNCPATMAIETLEATSKYKKPKSVSIAPTLPY
ncbi:hypothetical protein OUZ56_005369 [Daphnia magna]|uniref:Uncharacterized protein n=1 Tax=Daphnia magna TaxID=35525 RepID=A0ABQ9YSM1_9CRUS|nr:hypothetical protein OUZ56_005369 [Daphnia magna]